MSTRWKLGLSLWSAAMLGVVAMSLLVLPRLLGNLPELVGPDAPPLPAPLWMIVLAGLLQNGALLGLVVWAGVALSAPCGLHAPAFEAMAARRPVLDALRPQLWPGLIAGVLGGLLLATCSRLAPAQVQAAGDRLFMPLVVRVLYGGFTEEVLLRWGVMTVLVWLAFRFASRTSAWVWTANFVSALLFAAGHLPAAHFLVGPLTLEIVAYVLIVNTIFGVAFGWLYWRYGLEAAILAHAGTHVVSWSVASIT